MSKRDGKTEAPTEKRKRDARKKGTISKSQDLGPWIAVLVGTYALPATVGGTSEAATSAFASLRDLGAQPDTERAVDVLGRALFAGLTAVLPFLTVMIVVGVASHVAQAGLLVSMHPLRPDLKRLNPITGFKNLFSAKQLWNTGKQVAKSAVIGWLCWPKVQDIADELTGSGRVGLMDGLSASGHALLGMTRTTCWAIIVISLADFAFQRRSKLLDLRMTKQEIRDEMKNSEGDPHIKGRIRQMQMTLARSRMMNDVPTASVVVGPVVGAKAGLERSTLDDAIAHARVILSDTEKKLELDTLPKPQSPLEMLLGQTTTDRQPIAQLAELLPASMQPALHRLSVLRLIAEEPALLIMPFDVRFE